MKRLALSAALDLKSRECVKCGQTKPWREFYAATKWPDGTMRRPYPRCKACVTAEARERPYKPRSGEAAASKLERNRTYHRRKRDTPPERYRIGNPLRPERTCCDVSVDPGPLAAWFRELGDTPADVALRVGLDATRVGKVMRGNWRPSLTFVDRCLLGASTGVTLDDLYPCL